MNMDEKLETWTVTVECTVFAGDMDRDEVMKSAEEILQSLTDGSDIASIMVIDADRDTL